MKALKYSKEAEQYASNLADAHGKYADTMKEHKEAQGSYQDQHQDQSRMQTFQQTKWLQV